MKISASRFVVLVVALTLVASAVPARAEAPADVSELVSAEELAEGARKKAENIEDTLSSKESFARAIEYRTIEKNAGVIACLAQALVEHKKGDSTGVNAPALRDAALSLRNLKKRVNKREVVEEAVERINEALEGKGPDAEKQHPWNELINMHRMMEELEHQGGRLRRAVRRPRRLVRYSENAAILVVLALAMEADTHEVRNEDDLPQWKKWSREYRDTVSRLHSALEKGDGPKAKEIFYGSSELCDKCHEKFQD